MAWASKRAGKRVIKAIRGRTLFGRLSVSSSGCVWCCAAPRLLLTDTVVAQACARMIPPARHSPCYLVPSPLPIAHVQGVRPTAIHPPSSLSWLAACEPQKCSMAGVCTPPHFNIRRDECHHANAVQSAAPGSSFLHSAPTGASPRGWSRRHSRRSSLTHPSHLPPHCRCRCRRRRRRRRRDHGRRCIALLLPWGCPRIHRRRRG